MRKLSDYGKYHSIQWTPEKVERLWEFYSTSPYFNNTYFGMHSGGSVVEFVQKTISLGSKKVLDYGCGRGHMLRHLLKIGVACQGLEFSPSLAREAANQIGEHPKFLGVECAQENPEIIDDSSFDVVFLVEVIEHLFEEQIASTFEDIYRILRPGGYVVVTTPNEENLEASMQVCPECSCMFHRWQHMRSFSAGGLSTLVGEAGFSPAVCRALKFKSSGSRAASLVEWIQGAFRSVRRLPPYSPHLIYMGRKDLRSA